MALAIETWAAFSASCARRRFLPHRYRELRTLACAVFLLTRVVSDEHRLIVESAMHPQSTYQQVQCQYLLVGTVLARDDEHVPGRRHHPSSRLRRRLGDGAVLATDLDRASTMTSDLVPTGDCGLTAQAKAGRDALLRPRAGSLPTGASTPDKAGALARSGRQQPLERNFLWPTSFAPQNLCMHFPYSRAEWIALLPPMHPTIRDAVRFDGIFSSR